MNKQVVDGLTRYNPEKSNIRIYRIAVTGGPCAGKTTALQTIKQQLIQIGWKAYIVPEAATIMFKSGFSIDNTVWTDSDAIIFQTHLAKL